MIRNIFILIISLFCISGSLLAQNREFVFKAQLENKPEREGKTVNLKKMDYDMLSVLETINSTQIVGGKFSFKGIAPSRPEVYLVEIANDTNSEGDIMGFFITEPGEIVMTIDTLITIKGSAENMKHEKLQKKLLGFYKEFEKLKQQADASSAQHELTEEMLNIMSLTAKNITSDMNSTVFDYTKENMSNGVGEFYFINYASQFSIKQLKELFELANADFRTKATIESVMQQLVWSQDGVQDGNVFEGIKLSKPNGESENFGKHIGKGKVVLVDFWASWCPPCRREMPELVALYKKYKSKGFEIIGISLDESEESWKQAIMGMKMTWAQYADLKGGWESITARTYGINSIPRSFLLDKDGTIIAQNLKGEQLESKINELLK